MSGRSDNSARNTGKRRRVIQVSVIITITFCACHLLNPSIKIIPLKRETVNSVQIPKDSYLPLPRNRVIRTFYDNITSIQLVEQTQQIELWKQLWTERGWDARVLTMADARRHPLFESLYERIQKLNMCAEGFPMFQRLCFARWLAYAADGDGWMSDYDILPMNFDPDYQGADDGRLPNGGRFTSHDSSLAPLTSGTGEEITRVLILMLDMVNKYTPLRQRGRQCNDGTWQMTDQEILLTIRQHVFENMGMEGSKNEESADKQPIVFPAMYKGVVIHADDFIDRLQKSADPDTETGASRGKDCSEEYMAIHFSGKPTLKRDQRLDYMQNTYKLWKDECSNTQPPKR